MAVFKTILIIFLVILFLSLLILVISLAAGAGRCSRAEREWYDSKALEESLAQNEITN